MNINQLLFLSLIVGGDSLPRDSQLSVCSSPICMHHLLRFLLPSINYISLWSLKMKMLWEKHLTKWKPNNCGVVMEIPYAKFIRIQNRRDLHCQTSEHSKVNLVYISHGYRLILVLFYPWLRQSYDESEWVSLCVCPCQNVCAHSYAYILMFKGYTWCV